MAHIDIPSENRHLTDARDIIEYLRPHGIWYEKWDVERGLPDDADDQQVLEAYRPEIQRLRERGGYVAADVINVRPDTPNLQAMIDKFNKEHTHSEDEVRFIVKGRGVFHVRPTRVDGPVFAIQTEAGDLINVPAGTRHWFDFCPERTVRAIRLFLDKAGWTPTYSPDGVHERYTPVCWGPSYIAPSPEAAQRIRL